MEQDTNAELDESLSKTWIIIIVMVGFFGGSLLISSLIILILWRQKIRKETKWRAEMLNSRPKTMLPIQNVAKTAEGPKIFDCEWKNNSIIH